MPTDKPLLHLPPPFNSSYTPRRGGGGSHTHTPSHQITRLDTKFSDLERVFNQENAEFSLAVTGIPKEKTLVVVVKKSVAKFYNAVRNIEGLEWIGEEDWGDEESSKHCYLMMQSQIGLEKLLSCWRGWKNYYELNPDADNGYQFDRGLTPLRDVFCEIEDIRYWDEKDRLRESKGYEYLKTCIASCIDVVPVQVEFFYRRDQRRRDDVVRKFRSLFLEHGGHIVEGSECVIEEIQYHGLIATLNPQITREIINYYENPTSEISQHISFISCNDVMLFSAIGQAKIGKRDIDVDNLGEVREEPVLPDNSLPPVIAVLDGLPVANHLLLRDRLLIDDPDGWSESYPVKERLHGTEMVSLVTLGNLKNGADPLLRKVYLRPILLYSEIQDDEVIPEYSKLGIDLFHCAVRRMFEGDAVCPTVKIVNISLGDKGRVFSHFMSPWARLLDWLSAKYDVLFVVSGGNHDELSLEMIQDEFSALPDGNGWKNLVKHVYQEKAMWSILSPAESMNALTVGSVHPNIPSERTNDYKKNPLPPNLPCLYSPFGFGYLGSVKPDLLYYGGGMMVTGEIRDGSSPINIEMCSDSCTVCVAVPPTSGTQLNRIDFSSGTSNATALVTHELGKCYEVLEGLLENYTDHDRYMAVLLKAMAVHGALWGDIWEQIEPIFQGQNDGKIRQEITRWIGYGIADLEKVRECTSSRVTLFKYDLLSAGNEHVYSIQVPSCLHSMTHIRVTVTVAWMSPISANRTYRKTKLEVMVGRGNSFSTSQNSVSSMLSKKGTVIHTVYEFGSNTISVDNITISVGSPKGNEDAKYGLFATIEATEATHLLLSAQYPLPTLYDAVREALRVEVPSEQEIHIRS